MPTDGEITFADHAGRFYARRYGMAPMVGRLLGYLAVCDPREQSIAELADALLASRSAIAGAVTTLETLGLIRRSRAAGERMDRVCIDMSSPTGDGLRPLRVPGAGRAGPRRSAPAGRHPARAPGDLAGVGGVRRLPGGAASRARRRSGRSAGRRCGPPASSPAPPDTQREATR